MAVAEKPAGLTAKQWAFAVAIAAGATKADAYRSAYSAVGSSPSTCSNEGGKLLKRPEIARAVADIQRGASKAVGEHVGKGLELDRQYVMRNLKEVVERCMQREAIHDKSGNPLVIETPAGSLAAAYIFDAKGANQALALIGKELGMFVERKEVRHGPLAQASDAEINKEIADIVTELSQITGKPIATILRESLTSELAIDVSATPSLPALPHAIAANDARSTGTQGGVSNAQRRDSYLSRPDSRPDPNAVRP